MASPVWQYYKVSEKDNTFAVCNVCSKVVPRGGTHPRSFNTTNLIRHLKACHIKEFEEFTKLASAKADKDNERATSSQTPLTQLTVTETLNRHQPYSNDNKRRKELNAKVMEFICLDQQPLSVVEDAGFKRLVSCLDPRYTLPGRKYLTDVCLLELYQNVYMHINSLMKDNIKAVNFTSDIWSLSVCPMSMLSLTAQFINKNFELTKVVLHSQEFPGSHTAEALVAAFTDMFKRLKTLVPGVQRHLGMLG